ncbi:mCG146058, partial [Mus musculus]
LVSSYFKHIHMSRFCVGEKLWWFVLFLESGAISLSMVVFYSICLPGNDIILVCVCVCVCARLRERQTDRERWGRKSDTYLFICMEAKVGSGCLPFLLSTLFVCVFVCLFFNFGDKISYCPGAHSYRWSESLWGFSCLCLPITWIIVTALTGLGSKGVHACMANILSSQPPQSN